MMTLKNSKQIREEKQRLQKREAELKEKINASWLGLTGNAPLRPHMVDHSNGITPEDEEESILVSTLAYAGALLGRKIGITVEQKIRSFFSEEEEVSDPG
jgi:hypothetical protein